MNIIEIIDKKKYGQQLNEAEISYLIKGVVNSTLPDYQVSALLMAILLKGMDERETYYLTKHMAESGEQADLSGVKGITVDKHSTGGVGDSTTFVVIPVVAALGLKVAKMSGRALGHTGGTIDKLEAIPGYRVELTPDEFIKNVNSIGLSVIGQSLNICPADKKLYSLRDVTGTVDSIPLIASSIMSKKLAGGASTIVLDVKCGSGAFMQREDEAIKLAHLMVDIGKKAGRNMTAVVTDMNEPLDVYIGNKLEILGAINVLKGERNRLYEVCLVLAALIVESALKISHKEALERVKDVINNGMAYNKFLEMVKGQGGDIGYIEKIADELLPEYAIKSPASGYICAIDTKKLGNILVKLGGGRLKLNDKINYDVGLKVLKGIGDKVEKCESLLMVYNNQDISVEMKEEILSAYQFDIKPPIKKPLIIEIIK